MSGIVKHMYPVIYKLANVQE